MTTLLEQVLQKAQKLPVELQNKIAQQILQDIENEIRWQKTLSDSDANIDVLEQMAQSALREDEDGKTEDKGFGQE